MRMPLLFRACCFILAIMCGGDCIVADAAGFWKAGLARVRITPDSPVWLAGYSSREHPSEGTLQDIWAKALALEDSNGHRGVIVTMDLLSLPKDFSDTLRDRLCREYYLCRHQIILNVSHTHSGPVIGRSLKHVYPMGEEDWSAVDAYTRILMDRLVSLVGESLGDLRPARLSSGMGVARFAINRRNNNEGDAKTACEFKGPSDHSVPVLKVEDKEGRTLAVLFGYACHNTVLSDYCFNGDYAGFAQVELEKEFPGMMAMFFQGAGGDQNPLPRRKVSFAIQYGLVLSAAVKQVLSEEMVCLKPILDMRYEEIMLQMEAPLPVEELNQISIGAGYQARWASDMLAACHEGKSLSLQYPYPIQYWEIGSQRIFALGGEVVCGYSIELKSLFGQDVFVMGYCNDVMAYIPTETVWEEGGYEGLMSHRVYGLPSRWTRDVHDRIIQSAVSLAKVNTNQ